MRPPGKGTIITYGDNRLVACPWGRCRDHWKPGTQNDYANRGVEMVSAIRGARRAAKVQAARLMPSATATTPTTMRLGSAGASGEAQQAQPQTFRSFVRNTPRGNVILIMIPRRRRSTAENIASSSCDLGRMADRVLTFLAHRKTRLASYGKSHDLGDQVDGTTSPSPSVSC
jgi:hypothetical protein